MNGFLQALFAFARRYPVVVVSLTLFLLLSVADYFLWQRNLEIGHRHDRILQDALDAQVALSGHARLQAQLATVEGAVSHIEKNLVVETDLAGNSDYFYQLEKASGVRLGDLNQLNSQPAADDNPYRAIPFSLRLSGSYNQILAFLRGLENGPRVLRVKRYSFARGTVGPENLALDLTIEMLGHP
jgi:Tfp pilus assembly protein PilO